MKKILIIKHGSLGDIIFSLDAMYAIRKKYPNSLIHLLTEKKYISFFKKSRFFDKIIEDDRKIIFLKTIFNLLKLLKENYNTVIDLQNSQRTLIYNLFFRLFDNSLICSSKYFAHLRYNIPIQGKESVRLGLSNQLKLLKIYIEETAHFDWLKVNLNDDLIDTPTVLFIPGVSPGNKYKQWQPEKFAEVAKYCELKKYRICIVGTKLDLYCAQPILSECKNVLNKINSSPPEVIYSIALKSTLIFSNDTGPGHIASLANNHMIWILNDNNVSKANIINNEVNHKITSDSVRNISSKLVIQYIEKNNLLKTSN